MKKIDWRSGLTLPHDPQDIEDYVLDSAEWVGTETIASVEVEATDVMAIAGSPDSGTVPFRVSGGTVDTTAKVTIRVITSSGRSRDRTIRFKVSPA